MLCMHMEQEHGVSTPLPGGQGRGRCHKRARVESLKDYNTEMLVCQQTVQLVKA